MSIGFKNMSSVFDKAFYKNIVNILYKILYTVAKQYNFKNAVINNEDNCFFTYNFSYISIEINKYYFYYHDNKKIIFKVCES